MTKGPLHPAQKMGLSHQAIRRMEEGGWKKEALQDSHEPRPATPLARVAGPAGQPTRQLSRRQSRRAAAGAAAAAVGHVAKAQENQARPKLSRAFLAAPSRARFRPRCPAPPLSPFSGGPCPSPPSSWSAQSTLTHLYWPGVSGEWEGAAAAEGGPSPRSAGLRRRRG